VGDDDRRPPEPLGDLVRRAGRQGEHDLGRREHRGQVRVVARPRLLRRVAQLVHGHHERDAEPAQLLGPVLERGGQQMLVAGVQVKDVDLTRPAGEERRVEPAARHLLRADVDGVGRKNRLDVRVGVRDGRHPEAGSPRPTAVRQDVQYWCHAALRLLLRSSRTTAGR
jgi:hypothetical protein